VQVFGSPMHLSATPPRTRGDVPELGQHNRQVYLDWLGVSDERYAALCAAGTI
jgi:CoA:oxalate CoA-transferase